jgi:hypothetical protein
MSVEEVLAQRFQLRKNRDEATGKLTGTEPLASTAKVGLSKAEGSTARSPPRRLALIALLK